jgi:hypothetical protein
MDHATSDIIRVFLNEIRTGINKINKETQLDDFILSKAAQLDYLGTLGLSSSCKIRDTFVLEELEKNGIKLWIVSGEN